MGLMFDNVDLKTEYGFVVTRVDGRASPPLDVTSFEFDHLHGGVILNKRFKPREITITGYVHGSASTLQSKKDNLLKLLASAYDREVPLTFPDTNRTIYVRLAGEPLVIGPVGPSLNAKAYELTIRFVAYDPFFYGSEQSASGTRVVRLNAGAPSYLVLPSNLQDYYKREPKLRLEAYTVINRVGKTGNFETDNNNDGISDGWSTWGTKGPGVIFSRTSGYFGSYSQKVYIPSYTCTNDVDSNIVAANISIFPNKHYWFSLYVRTTKRSTGTFYKDGVVILDRLGGTNVYGFYRLASKNTSDTWKRYTVSFKDVSNNTSLVILLGNVVYNGEVSPELEAYFDGVMLVDLTAMGKLPLSLIEYFDNQVTYWSDLATTSNLTARDGRVMSGNDWLAELIPYVENIGSVNYALTGGW